MLRRSVALAGMVACLVVTGTVTSSVPALADGRWGGVDCSQNPHPGCELWAGKDGDGNDRDRGDGRERRTGTRRQSDSGPDEAERPSDGLIGESRKSGKCRYVRSDFQPPGSTMRPAAFVPSDDRRQPQMVNAVFQVDRASAGAGAASARLAPGDGGAWYVYQCARPGFRDALWRPPVWIPDGEDVPDGPLPSPEELAQLARDQLNLPDPEIMSSPAGEQLVHLPTWLWLDPQSWNEVTATASVPGVSVTAVAKPTSVSWSMGDGESTTCKGPGTPYSARSNPRSASPDCGYTYRTSSARQSGQSFPVTGTVRWTVSWSGAGQSGVFPDMTTTGSTRFRVAESQALNTDQATD